MIICLSLSSIPKLRTPKMLIFSIRDIFANVSYLDTKEPGAHRVLTVRLQQGERGTRKPQKGQKFRRRAARGGKGSGWSPSFHTRFLFGWWAREAGTSSGMPSQTQKQRPSHPATARTHRFPLGRPHGSRESERVHATRRTPDARREVGGLRRAQRRLPGTVRLLARCCCRLLWIYDFLLVRGSTKGTN